MNRYCRACTELPKSFLNWLRVKSGLHSWGLPPYWCQTQVGTCKGDLERDHGTYKKTLPLFFRSTFYCTRHQLDLLPTLFFKSINALLEYLLVSVLTQPQYYSCHNATATKYSIINSSYNFRFSHLVSEPWKQFKQNTASLSYFVCYSVNDKGFQSWHRLLQKGFQSSSVLTCLLDKPTSLYGLQRSHSQMSISTPWLTLANPHLTAFRRRSTKKVMDALLLLICLHDELRIFTSDWVTASVLKVQAIMSCTAKGKPHVSAGWKAVSQHFYC